jgi:hypothetical protein
MPLNLHFLACLPHTLEAPLLAGARAANFNPHFQHFSSRELSDASSGSEQSRPPVPVLLCLDSESYGPTERERKIYQASYHEGKVWILRPDCKEPDPTIPLLLVASTRGSKVGCYPLDS